ncbi:hypothetical protein I4641_22145 [Waterburya agarophytonicola K14]|uniref:Uncharacterized protein n=1 Tax=Waterburya agarophytonicola KI4 TaxID=2874699 RepID=A0A964BY60_9CYAN|nr:hypothetical protein [Waterburya agarophytonicola]MCC0179657.1 hypothetical protein [Waterburya agarophytonicola KI4]
MTSPLRDRYHEPFVLPFHRKFKIETSPWTTNCKGDVHKPNLNKLIQVV